MAEIDIDIDGAMTDERWDAMTPTERKTWYRARHATVESRRDFAGPGRLTRDDLYRLSMLKACDPDEKDKDLERLQRRLRTPRA